jgi:HEAT repeat protein/beta-lactamase regulating signal transducer with metallopeptidase domain
MIALSNEFADPGASAAAWLATYWLHSTILLACAWALHRWVLEREAWREVIWKAALVGGVVTATVSTAERPWGMRLTVPLPGVDAIAAAPADDAVTAEKSKAADAAGSPAVVSSAPTPSAPATSDGTQHAAVPAEGLARAPAAPASADARSRSPIAPERRPFTTALASIGENASSLFLFAWVGVALALLGALARRHLRLHRLLSDRRTVSDGPLPAMLAGLRRSTGVWQPVRLSATGSVATPLALGRSEICVPERFLERLGEEEQMAALAHELGHLARRDPSWHLVAQTLEAIFFFQPLNRIARLKLRESAEYLADEWAVRQTGSRLGLARCLAEVADWVASVETRDLAGTVAMAEGGSPLLVRVRRLLEREPESPTPPMAGRVAAVTLIALTAGFAPAVSSTVANVIPPSEEKTSDEVTPVEAELYAQTVEVIRVSASGSLAERMRSADEMAAASGARAYWVGYVVDGGVGIGEEVMLDTGQYDSWPQRGPAVEGLLGVAADVGPAGSGDVILLAQAAPRSPRPRIVRLALRSPGLTVDFQGRPVYWLGRADTEESLAWAHGVFLDAGEDGNLRETALEVVGHHPLPRAREILVGIATRDEVPELRVEAVEELANHPEDQTVELLAGLAASDRDPDVRQEAAETLGEVVSPLAAAALQNLIVNARDVDVRQEALESLAQVSDTLLAAVLLEMALRDPDPDLRLEAVEGMEELLPEVAIPLLRRVLSESSDRQVRIQVVETLGEIGTLDALAALDEVLDDPDYEVAAEVVSAIGELPAEFAEPRLARIARSHPLTEVRYEALEHLADLGGSVAADLLLELALTSGNTDLSTEAVERIDELPPEQAVGPLTRIVFESQNLEVKVEAVGALGDVGTTPALEALDRIVREIDIESVVIAAVDSIGEFETNAARAILSRLATQHPSPRVRREAREALGGGQLD